MKADSSRGRLGQSFTIDYLLFNKGVQKSTEEPFRCSSTEQAKKQAKEQATEQATEPSLSNHVPEPNEVTTSEQINTIQPFDRGTIKRSSKEGEEEEMTTTTSDFTEEKPNQSYIALISKAILASEPKKLLLCDIYQWIMDQYPYFKSKDKNWRNSVRHNLSLNDCFIKAGRSDNGKGHYWAIHPSNFHDFSKGDYHCRRARRRVRRLGGQVPLMPPYPSALFGGHRTACWCCPPQSPTVTYLPTRLYWPWPHLQPHGGFPLVHTPSS